MLHTKEEYEAFIDVDVPSSPNDYIGSMKPSESMLYVPIHFGETILGTLSVQSYTPHVYTQRHVEMLQEISVQAGIAIMNARLYTELREAVRHAQESEQLKNHFLMIASHELRTPLTAIQGYLELLSIHGASLSEKDRTRFVSNARRASEEVILLLGNVMDTSRLNQKEIALNLKKVQLHQTLLPVLDILEPTLIRQKRKVDDALDDTLSVHADEARLRQILLNVLNNAIKYTPTGTDIRVSAEVKSSSSLPKAFQMHRPDTQFVVLAIRDRGDGISVEDLDRLFTKFVRLPSALESTQHGSGLGLYLCRQLVEAMKGAIWAESAGIEGEGTTFYIALPQVLA
jgi:signal transduction histidine kinase